MKIRNCFVSNSSTSSFIVTRSKTDFETDEENLKRVLEEHYIDEDLLPTIDFDKFYKNGKHLTVIEVEDCPFEEFEKIINALGEEVICDTDY